MVHSLCNQSVEDVARLEREAQAAGKKLAVELANAKLRPPIVA